MIAETGSTKTGAAGFILPVVSSDTASLQGVSTRRNRNASPHGAPLRLPHTDWLHYRLTVTGPVETFAALQNAASGAGTVLWRLDRPSLEERWFHLLANPAHRMLSLQGACILARQLRDAVEARHALATSSVGHSRACPLDLHALIPLPPIFWHSGRTTRTPSSSCGRSGARRKCCATWPPTRRSRVGATATVTKREGAACRVLVGGLDALARVRAGSG